MRLITQYFPARRLTLLAPVFLAACVGSPSEWDFDFRPNAPRAGNVTVADRPDPDSRGLISYDSYQVAIARRGDTVADVATRIGLPPAELASFNGRAEADELRSGEVLALPRRVDGGTPATGSGTDIASIAGAAIDAAVARAFKEAMRDMIEDGPPVVILDLGQVTFIDSSGLGAVVATLKLLLPDRSLTLAGLTPSVDRVFRLTRMDSVFPLFPTLDAALAAQVPA